tara:strand:+ start:1929 stop:2102 length:174 start_codon:yes stop_codon:yes gene_type:complete
MPKIKITNREIASLGNATQQQLFLRMQEYLDSEFENAETLRTELDKAKQDITNLTPK